AEKRDPLTPKETAMRTIEDHKVNPADATLVIQATDEPGAGGANHRYEITGMSFGNNPSLLDAAGHHTQISDGRSVVLFQNGPIPDAGVNGVTHEALLAIVADRLRSFQAGAYSCRENALALTKIEEAMHWL